MSATLEEVGEAARRIRGRVHVTPVMHSDTLDALVDCHVTFKCENLQRAGSFKVRGAMNQCLQLSGPGGVVTHSSGNHGAALALAARECGRACTVVMPHDAPACKVAAVAAYGARIVRCAPAERASTVAALLAADRTLHFVHPSAALRTLLGQGTAALELLQQAPPGLAALLCPVGGGGLLAGCSAVGAAVGVPVFGCEPRAAGPDALLSWRTGAEHRPVSPADTMADGLRTHLEGDALRVVHAHTAGVMGVDERDIALAVRLLFERAKLVVEPSGALGLAALLACARRPLNPFRGQRVAVILSGGNLDAARCKL